MDVNGKSLQFSRTQISLAMVSHDRGSSTSMGCFPRLYQLSQNSWTNKKLVLQIIKYINIYSIYISIYIKYIKYIKYIIYEVGTANFSPPFLVWNMDLPISEATEIMTAVTAVTCASPHDTSKLGWSPMFWTLGYTYFLDIPYFFGDNIFFGTRETGYTIFFGDNIFFWRQHIFWDTWNWVYHIFWRHHIFWDTWNWVYHIFFGDTRTKHMCFFADKIPVYQPKISHGPSPWKSHGKPAKPCAPIYMACWKITQSIHDFTCFNVFNMIWHEFTS